MCSMILIFLIASPYKNGFAIFSSGCQKEQSWARLFRCSLRSREEQKLAHLAGHIAGDGTLLRPCKCLVDISAFQNPKSAHVLLGLGVRPVGDEHLSVGLLSQRLCVIGRGN